MDRVKKVRKGRMKMLAKKDEQISAGEGQRENEKVSSGWHSLALYTRLTDLHGNRLLCQDFLFLLVVCLHVKKMSPAHTSSTDHVHISDSFQTMPTNAHSTVS